jgi:hypothetical protein
MKPQKRKLPGRAPRKPLPAERFALSLRLAPEVKLRLDAECKANGRSQSQEAEYRLARSFWLDDLIKTRLISIRGPAALAEKGE